MRLRQGIELAGIHAAGHHEVACALGSGLDEHRGLNLQEVAVGEVVAHQHSHAVAHLEVAAHGVAAYVEVAVLHAEVVAAVALVLDGEGRHFGLVEDVEGSNLNLNLSGRYFGVLRAALDNLAGNLYHVFAPQLASLLAEGGVGLHVESQLRDAVAVAQVDESHAAEVARALHPSGEGDCLSHIGEAKLAASISPIHNYVYFHSQ